MHKCLVNQFHFCELTEISEYCIQAAWLLLDSYKNVNSITHWGMNISAYERMAECTSLQILKEYLWTKWDWKREQAHISEVCSCLVIHCGPRLLGTLERLCKAKYSYKLPQHAYIFSPFFQFPYTVHVCSQAEGMTVLKINSPWLTCSSWIYLN